MNQKDRITEKYIIAMAAMFYTRYNTYTKTYRKLSECFIYMPLSIFSMRVNLKHLGFGINYQKDAEAFKIGETGWVLTRIPSKTYQRWWSKTENTEFFISHHHPNGAAFEVRPNSKWKEQHFCVGCGAEVPKQVKIWINLNKLGKHR